MRNQDYFRTREHEVPKHSKKVISDFTVQYRHTPTHFRLPPLPASGSFVTPAQPHKPEMRWSPHLKQMPVFRRADKYTSNASRSCQPCSISGGGWRGVYKTMTDVALENTHTSVILSSFLMSF